jgi:hypothetical protein
VYGELKWAAREVTVCGDGLEGCGGAVLKFYKDSEKSIFEKIPIFSIPAFC